MLARPTPRRDAESPPPSVPSSPSPPSAVPHGPGAQGCLGQGCRPTETSTPGGAGDPGQYTGRRTDRDCRGKVAQVAPAPHTAGGVRRVRRERADASEAARVGRRERGGASGEARASRLPVGRCRWVERCGVQSCRDRGWTRAPGPGVDPRAADVGQVIATLVLDVRTPVPVQRLHSVRGLEAARAGRSADRNTPPEWPDRRPQIGGHPDHHSRCSVRSPGPGFAAGAAGGGWWGW
ncbi:hypothetical protein JOF29_003118 [Kribbella aluminosa]|uniref:Uncharacterized protein n=1 Tax=Kribbella aluminosa TaxID=416017 RepID=A0ABS4UK89_9ACTN|nr:hypothetical protein [Kribbella aluminosa]